MSKAKTKPAKKQAAAKTPAKSEVKEQAKGQKTMFNFHLGIAASSLLLAILVIGGELFAPLKDLLKNVFTHHWIGKAVIISLVFFIAGYLARNREAGKIPDEELAWKSTLASIAAIFAFYIIHYFLV